LSPELHIMTAQVTIDDGPAVAVVERVTIGGGFRVIEGEEIQHPSFVRHHVRLISPDRMFPDQLIETESYDEAVAVAMKYGDKRVEHAARVDELARDLQV
jgi:hypothetical protein